MYLHFLDGLLLLGDFEMLAGNLASIGVGGIVAVVASLVVCKNMYLDKQLTLTDEMLISLAA